MRDVARSFPLVDGGGVFFDAYAKTQYFHKLACRIPLRGLKIEGKKRKADDFEPSQPLVQYTFSIINAYKSAFATLNMNDLAPRLGATNSLKQQAGTKSENTGAQARKQRLDPTG